MTVEMNGKSENVTLTADQNDFVSKVGIIVMVIIIVVNNVSVINI